MNLTDFVTDALRRATIVGQTATPSAEQGADALTKLNDVMASLRGDGIDLGYNPKATTAESIQIPLEHVLSVKCMLVVAVCNGYGIEPPIVDAGIASSGYRRMLTQALYAGARETRTDNAPRGDSQGYGSRILTDQ